MKMKLILLMAMLMISFASAYVVYDEIDDSSINTTLWTTGGTSTPVENADYIQGTSSCGDTACSSDSNLTTIDVERRYDGMENMTLRVSLSSTKGNSNPANDARTNFTFMGTNVIGFTTTGSDDSVWTFVRNRTAGEDIFEAYNDGSHSAQINASGQAKELNFYTLSEGSGGSSGSNTANFLVYYVYYNTDVEVNPITPSNATTFLQSDSIIFNASLISTSSTLKNATLYINGASNETVNVTGASNFSEFTKSFNLGTYVWWIEGCADSNICSQSQNRTLTVSEFKENSQGYTTPVTESSINEFSINLSYYPTSFSVGATLVYNNTEYPSTISEDAGDSIVFYYNLTAPAITTQTAFGFYWNISLTNSTGTYYFTSQNYSQTVDTLSEITVATSCSDQALRFDIQDESNLTSLYGDVEYNFQYGVGNGTTNTKYGSLSNVTTFYLCINATQSTEYVIGYGEIQYTANSMVERRYYLWNDQVVSNNTLTNHSLRLIADADQTSFLMTMEDTSLTQYTDKYVALWRWYPDLNAYQVVEMGKTDENGETVSHIVTEDVDYRVGLYERNGTLIKLGEPLRFLCTSAPCTFTLRVGADELDYSSIFDVQTSLTYNSTTKVFTFVWNDPNQLTSSMRLLVTRETGSSTLTVCDSTTASYTGVMTCNVSAYTGTFRAVIYRSASPAVAINQLLINQINDTFRTPFGLFISAIIWLAIILTGLAGSPVGAIMLGIIGLIPALIFGTINLAIFTGIIVMGVLIVHFVKMTKS